MDSIAELRASLGRAMDTGDPKMSTADRLCHACVDLLDVDGAAISLMLDGSSQGTFGSSDALSRQLDEFQFTFGEGPCMDALRDGPVFAPDIGDVAETRWPAFVGSATDLGVGALFALPISLANSHVGALDLYRQASGPLLGNSLIGGLMAAELAALPLLDMISAEAELAASGRDEPAWKQLASLARVEVYQATGMVMAQLGVGPADALARLRAHAFAQGLTASQVAWSIVERELSLETDNDRTDPGRRHS
ncbi:MAG TPA: GAF and ANTAR domain-containing protein [Acidothermaceae bacterium]|nr:GAF and ANTAR domain-containing protein [Acidothermaceae bacterium]